MGWAWQRAIAAALHQQAQACCFCTREAVDLAPLMRDGVWLAREPRSRWWRAASATALYRQSRQSRRGCWLAFGQAVSCWLVSFGGRLLYLRCLIHCCLLECTGSCRSGLWASASCAPANRWRHAAGQAVAARVPGQQAGEAPAEPVRLRSAGDAPAFAGFPRLDPLDAGPHVNASEVT